MSGSIAPPVLAAAQQPMGGQMSSSPLAAAMMSRMGAGGPQLSNPMGGIPFGMLAQLMNQKNSPNQLQQNGYMGNGMPGPSMMGDLSGQAMSNVMNGGPY